MKEIKKVTSSDRSVAQWRDLRFLFTSTSKTYTVAATLNFVIPTRGEGPAVSAMLREITPPDSKPRSRWLACAAITLALIGVGIAIIYSRQRLSIDPRQVTLPADGAEHPAFRIRLP
jgi:hypothetical protein